MSQQDKSQSPWTSLPATPGVLLLTVVLYLASLGPFCRLHSMGAISDETFDRAAGIIYFPVMLIDERTDFFQQNPAGHAYAQYVEWWDN